MNKDFLVTLGGRTLITRKASAGGAAFAALHFHFKTLNSGRDLGANSEITVNVRRISPCVAKNLMNKGTRKI